MAMVILVWFVAVILAVIALLVHMWREAHLHHIVSEEVELRNLPSSFDGSKILYLSDIHKRKLNKNDLEHLRNQVDWVIIGGDVAEKGISWSIVRHNMSLLSYIAPTFTVYGNHDKRAGTVHLERIFRDTGVQLLQDSNVYLRKGKSKLCLVGVDYRSRRGDSLLAELDNKDCKIAVVHDPLEALHLNAPVDLMLSGHTHGGQLVIPGFGPVFLNKAYRSVSSGWFSLKKDGKDTGQEGKMLVSKGYGTNHLPFRLCCPAEMHIITLRMLSNKQP
ncbi:metallophosphoesterase [Paenibacillus sp. OK003]|uniref:metallophosphoesterase n=1 Tax=Paenibacillus sp. OK003 TaxID=1884380 RepID=UPI0008B5E0DF|nr:metallophosphoesterase [Paenibacillus sp. OK003]SEL36493.1 Predicted phosphohydrolase, MPP superfamily [Paenibacillus sp. OK003]